MFLEINKRKQFLLVRCRRNCNLNSSNIEEFKENILGNYHPKLPVILNFDNLDFIDSAGLTVLIHIRRKVSESKGTLKLVNLNDRVHKLMQITRLHRVFEIYETIDSAIKSIEKISKQSNKTNPYNLHVQVKKNNSYYWVKIKQPDSLIKANTKQFRAKMCSYLDKTNTLILNFDNIRNIDSAGIASLIHLKRLSRENKKKIFLVYDNRVLNKLFKLYSLDDLFSQFHNDEDAISAVKPVRSIEKIKEVKPKVQPAGIGLDFEFSDIAFLASFKKE
jgi:anti-anti-sigma factor